MERLKIGLFLPAYRRALRVEVVFSILRDFDWCGQHGHRLTPFYADTCNIAKSRNLGVAMALDGQCDYLLMQDADCFVTGESGLAKLVGRLQEDPDAGAAGAVILTRRDCMNANPAKPGLVYRGEVGTGYMLINLARLRARKLAGPWFRHVANDDGTSTVCGEDIYFCRLLSSCGLHVIVDYTMATGHACEHILCVDPEQIANADGVTTAIADRAQTDRNDNTKRR